MADYIVDEYFLMSKMLADVVRLQVPEMYTRNAIAYFDESGKLHDHAIVSFAGYAGLPEHWDNFNLAWARALKGTGVKCVSMKDAMTFHGEFMGWSGRSADRDEVLITLAETIRSFRFAGISLSMNTQEFRALPPEDRHSLKDVQYCGFEGAVKGIMDDLPSDCAMQIVCDLSEEYSEKCVSLYNKLRARDAEFKHRCWAVSFADDERTPPLQAADMWAYCVRVKGEHIAPSAIVSKLTEILEGDRMESGWFVFKRGRLRLGEGTFESKPTVR